MIGLGVDAGSTNLKVALVEVNVGREPGVRTLARDSCPTPAAAETLVADCLRLIETVLGRAGRLPDCVGLASMAESGVPLDAADRPVGDLVRWDGRHGAEDAAALARTHGAGALFAATGVRPQPKTPLAVWAWLRRAEPERWRAMRRWAGTADLLALALTGALVTDHTLAGRTMAYRLPAPGAALATGFDADLLAAVGLRPAQLPAVAAPGAVAGRVLGSAPGGLRPGTPVVVAGHDHAVGAWAGGVREPGQVADSLGTAEAVIRVVGRRPDPEPVRAAGMSLVRTVTGDHEAVVAGSASAGAMLDWWLTHLAGPAAGPDLPVAAVFAEAGRRGGPNGLFVLPYASGRQTPEPDPQARARLVGDARGRDLADLARALLDGLSLHARWMISEQARLVGADPATGEVTVLGAATPERAGWLSTKAAVGPAPLRAVREAEPVAAGAALLAVARISGRGSAAPRLASRPGPVPRRAAYDTAYAEFVRAARKGFRPTPGVCYFRTRDTLHR